MKAATMVQGSPAHRALQSPGTRAVYDGSYRKPSGRARKRCVSFQVQVQGEAIGMDIYDWRKKIDEMDEEIVRLISRRAEAAKAIGELKRKTLSPVYEPDREQTVFNHVRAVNPGPLSDGELLHVYERLIDVMRTLQKRDR
jgi:chorismate mutase